MPPDMLMRTNLPLPWPADFHFFPFREISFTVQAGSFIQMGLIESILRTLPRSTITHSFPVPELSHALVKCLDGRASNDTSLILQRPS